MSFKLNWNAIEKDSFAAYAKELLEEALNSGKRPTILSDDITIVDLNFGTVAPNFQILEIGDLGIDRFRGIFNFKYHGDASITVKTKISASLMKNYNNNLEEEFSFVKPSFILSDCDFDIPLNLRLSNIELSSIIIIVFNKTKGLTLVFKNDPLENIDVNSTFDKITPIADFLQKKIESQISDLFKEFLPSLLYKFSLKYTSQSFDQFHKDLLNREQFEEEKKNKILLKDLEPENPFRISPASLMKTTRLASARQTLSLGNGIDRLSFDRYNKEIITKAFLHVVLDRRKNYIPNKIEMHERDFATGDVYSKIEYIKEFQSKMFTKNTTKPKRRVFKMRMKEKKRTSVDDKEEMETEMEVDKSKVNEKEENVQDHVLPSHEFKEEFCDIDEGALTEVEGVHPSRPVSKRGSMHRNTRPEAVTMSRNSTSTKSTLMSKSTSTSMSMSDIDMKDRSRRSSMAAVPAMTTSTNPARTALVDEKAAMRKKYSEQHEIRRRIMKLDKLVKEKNTSKLREHSKVHVAPLPYVPPPPPYSL